MLHVKQEHVFFNQVDTLYSTVAVSRVIVQFVFSVHCEKENEEKRGFRYTTRNS